MRDRCLPSVEVQVSRFKDLIFKLRAKPIIVPIACAKAKQVALQIAMLLRFMGNIDVRLIADIVELESVSLRLAVPFEGQPAILIVGSCQIHPAHTWCRCMDWNGDTKSQDRNHSNK